MSATKYSKIETRKAKSIYDILNVPSKIHPYKTLFRYRRNTKECEISYEAFRERVDCLACAIEDAGFSSSHIAIIGKKCPEWLCAYFGIIKSGAVAVPLDKELDRTKIADFTLFADCDCVIYTDDYSEVFETDDERLDKIKLFIKISPSVSFESVFDGEVEYNFNRVTDRVAHFYDFLRYGKSVDKKEKTDDAKICADLDKMSLIIFTSGTTGTSKGVMLSQRNVLFCVHAAAKLTEVTGDDVLLSALPFHHTYEMTAGILTGMLLGCTICINEKLTSLLSDFKIYKPTAMAMVPLMVNTINKKIEAKIKKEKKQKLVDAAAKVSNVLSGVGINVKDKLFKQILEAFGGRLKKIVCGGAALNPTLVKRFRNYGISIKQGYGITECAPVISLVPYDVFNPDSCGMLLEGMQIMIDKISPDDKTGEILVKGDNVMLGYYKNEQATNAVLWGGWFATGDCGYVDSDNFIYITGRKKNVIVLANGKNVFPEEIEEYLEKIEFVSECCVVARTASDDKENIKLSAIIYPDYEGLKGIGVTNEEEVKGFFKDKVTILNKSLASFKQINIIEVRQKPFVKTTTQKIQRHKIDEE